MSNVNDLLTQALALVNEDQDGELNDIELPRALESAALLVCTGRADVADLVEIASRHAHAVCVLELRAMAAALEKSAAADWPDGGRASRRRRGQQDAFDDGLLTATGRLRCRAAVLENEGVKP